MANAIQAPIETLVQMGKSGIERVHREHNVTTEAAKLWELIQAHSFPAEPFQDQVNRDLKVLNVS
jgi:hypothetical protein